MLTKLKRELNVRPLVGDLHTSEPVDPIEEEEEVDNTWQPEDTLKATLKSLSLFDDMKGMKKKEIRDSYDNFDTWLKSEIYRIVAIEKGKEDDAVWGDLE